MKKMMKMLGIIAVAVCLGLTALACSDGDKKGGKVDPIEVVAVAKTEATTFENALKAYVADELEYSREYTESSWDEEKGERVEVTKERKVIVAEYLGYQSKGEVKAENIKLSDADKTGLVSADKYSVKAKVGMAASEEETKFEEETWQTVYVLKYGDTKYKYMVSQPEVGERITNSYIKSVTDYTKYLNCTLTSINRSQEDGEDSLKFYNASEYKLASNAIYSAYYRNEERFNNRTPGSSEDRDDYLTYLVNAEKGLVSVSSNWNDTDEKYEWEAYDMSEYYDSFNAAVEDYSGELAFGMFSETGAALFKKTATGFEFKYVETEEDSESGDKTTTTVEYVITVTDGKITAMDMNIKDEGTEDGETYTEIEEYKSTISAFGTTTVTVPAEVTEAINALASEE